MIPDGANSMDLSGFMGQYDGSLRHPHKKQPIVLR